MASPTYFGKTIILTLIITAFVTVLISVVYCIFSKEEGPTKCIDKVCVTPDVLNNTRNDHPEEYFEADEDFFYVSPDELPWSQAQYECLTRKGHLAELDGKAKKLQA